MMKMLLLAITLLLSQAIFASPVFPTGNDIYDNCIDILNPPPSKKGSVEDVVNLTMCTTALGTSFGAVIDMRYLWPKRDGELYNCMNKHYRFDEFSIFQIFDLFIQYVKANPMYRSESINIIMLNMMQDNFPSSVCE